LHWRSQCNAAEKAPFFPSSVEPGANGQVAFEFPEAGLLNVIVDGAETIPYSPPKTVCEAALPSSGNGPLLARNDWDARHS
jgi:hypothetical protein